jgi:hypothetical protein
MLRWSYDPSVAPWVLVGATVVTPNYAAGPDPNGPRAARVVISALGVGPEQTIATNSDRTITAGIWVRSTGASAALTLRLRVGTLLFDTVAVIGPQWTFLSVSGASSEGLTAVLLRILSTGVSADFLLCGAFVKHGAGVPMTTYQTGAEGLLVPANPYTGNRQALFDLSNQGTPYTRVLIPAQSTTDSSGSFATGQALTVANLSELPDFPQLPLSVEVKNGQARLDHDDEAREYLTLGNPYVALHLQGSFASHHALASLQRLSTAPLGSLVLVHHNLHTPGSENKAFVNPSESYITQLTGRSSFSFQQLPEIVDFSWDLTEVV